MGPKTRLPGVKAIMVAVGREILVLWNGDVPYCEQDYDGETILGNITRESLSAIWERTQDIRLKHLTGDDGLPDMCRKCSEWYYV